MGMQKKHESWDKVFKRNGYHRQPYSAITVTQNRDESIMMREARNKFNDPNLTKGWRYEGTTEPLILKIQKARSKCCDH